MKKIVVFVVTLLVVFLLSGWYFWNKNDQLNQSHEKFHAQLREKWERVMSSYDLACKNLGDKSAYKAYAYDKYKGMKTIQNFDVDPSCVEAAKPEIKLFGEVVVYPSQDLYDAMTQDISGSGDQWRDIKRTITEYEKDLDRYWADHYSEYQLVPVPKRADEIIGKLAKYYVPKPASQPATKVVVVSAYPSWINNAAQKQGYDSMSQLVSRYFAARLNLSRRLNWTKAKQDPRSYFSYSDVRAILQSEMDIRRQMYNEVQSVKQIEGMSELGSQLETMLQNSFEGLKALYERGDYSSFKSYNNANDAISASIRKTFGIR